MPPPDGASAGAVRARVRAIPPLYLITDRTRVPGGDLPAAVLAAVSAGVRMVQLREKDLPARDLLTLAKRLRAITGQHHATLLINGRADVAMAAGADGVHLPGHNPPVEAMRRLLGETALIGVSTHTEAEIAAAGAAGADFVTFGPVFDTLSKRGMGVPAGVDGLTKAVSGAGLPVYALGGIHLPEMPAVLHSGCHGVAVISEIMAAPRPEQAARALVAAVNMGRNS